jgi:hypothetical protein
MPKKLKIVNKMRFFVHQGKKLTPLTEVEAKSLDKGDVIKYIGPKGNCLSWAVGGGYSSYGGSAKDEKPYPRIGRRALALQSHPDVFTKKDPHQFFLRINYYSIPLSAPIEHFALVQRGDPHTADFKKALRLVPEHLYSFKRSIEASVARANKKIDKYLNTLPIHKRMEVFKSFTKEQQLIYDFLSSGFEEEIIQEKKDETDQGTAS